MRFCEKCGAAVQRDNQKYCVMCGASLNTIDHEFKMQCRRVRIHPKVKTPTESTKCGKTGARTLRLKKRTRWNTLTIVICLVLLLIFGTSICAVIWQSNWEKKYQYVISHSNIDDLQTYEYLQELCARDYKDCQKRYDDLYKWDVELIFANTTSSNRSSIQRSIDFDAGYFHLGFRVKGGPPGETVDLVCNGSRFQSFHAVKRGELCTVICNSFGWTSPAVFQISVGEKVLKTFYFYRALKAPITQDSSHKVRHHTCETRRNTVSVRLVATPKWRKVQAKPPRQPAHYRAFRDANDND